MIGDGRIKNKHKLNKLNANKNTIFKNSKKNIKHKREVMFFVEDLLKITSRIREN